MAKYTPANVLAKSKFISADKSTTLTIVLTSGKSGFGVKATTKMVGDDAPKAMTGARHRFDDEARAREAYTALVGAAKERFWVEQTSASRNAFTEIPLAPGAPAVDKKRAAK